MELPNSQLTTVAAHLILITTFPTQVEVPSQTAYHTYIKLLNTLVSAD